MLPTPRLPTARAATFAALALPVLAACAPKSAITPATTVSAPQQVVTRIGTERNGSTEFLTFPTEAKPVANVLPADADRVFALLPAVFAELGVPVATIDAKQRMLGTAGTRVPRSLKGQALSRYLDCGTGAMGRLNADYYEVTLVAVTTVVPSPAGSELRTAIRGSARPAGVSGDAVNCTSRLRLEERIAEATRARLGAA